MNTRGRSLTILTSLACAVAAYSQTSTTSGAIRGTVKSKQRGSVVSAKLILRNVETGFSRTVTSDDKGGYSFSYLPVGTYELTVTAQGLKTIKNGNLRVTLGETTIQNFELDSAEAAAVVEVVADTTSVDSTQLNTVTSVTQELVEAIPVNGRNFTDLVQLTPGATAGAGNNSYRTVVEGARGIYNNLQVDGASYNNKFSAEQRGGTRVPFSFGQDSIRELQIIANAFDAQYGDASGAVVNAVTKSGTNEIQGMGMWLVRPSSLIANVKPVPYDPYGTVNAPAARKRDFSQSQFAFNLGGPIIKDKLHFFVNAEYLNWRQLNTPTVSLNTATDNASDFAKFYGLTTPPSQGMGNTLITSPKGLTMYQESQTPWYNELKNLTFFGRLDWTINSNHRLTLRMNAQNYTGENDTWNRQVKNNEAESNNNRYEIKNTSVVVELTSLLSENLVNEARIQVANEDRPVTPNSTISAAIGVPGFYTGQYSNAPARTKENLTQIVDNLSLMTGDWIFKGGIDLQFINMTNDYLAARGGSWYFKSYTGANHWWGTDGLSLTTGDVAEYTQGWSRLDGHVQFGEKLFAGYLQAQYSGLLSKRLIMSLGLRYTREMWDENPYTNPALQGLDHMPDSGSLDPRFGFTFDLFGNNKTVLRGGYGVFSSSNPGQNAATAITNNAINTKSYKVTYALNPGFFAPGGLLNKDYPGRIVGNSLKPLTQAELLTLPASTVQGTVIDPEARMAQSRVITIGVDQDMGHGLVLTARGTYKKFLHTQYWMNINMGQFNPATGLVDPNAIYNDGYAYRYNKFSTSARPGTAIVRGRVLDLSQFGGVFLSKYDGEGRYRALILEANRRSEKGFGFKSSLTFAKAEDNNSNERSSQGNVEANPSDPANPYRMARADSDVPFRAVFTGYMPKFWGIKVSGTATYAKGYRYSPRYYDDVNGDGLFNDYVDLLGGRNSQQQPVRKTFDMRISRTFRIQKHLSLEGIIDAYNVFNWANQTTSNTTYATNPSSTTTNSNFGLINVNDDRTREFQFTLKARF